MCGIAGFSSLSGNYHHHSAASINTLVAMRQRIAHRGHDQTGEYLCAHAGLAHTRLSIRDIRLGRQPMTRRREGATFSIAYNGEIYNADELREELRALGATFETASDTEVILEGYIHWGDGIIPRLNGIFAFAVWDDAKQRLLLARDRSGVKPLFYFMNDKKLIFASEIPALLEHPDVPHEIDEKGAAELLLIAPGRTAGCGVIR